VVHYTIYGKAKNRTGHKENGKEMEKGTCKRGRQTKEDVEMDYLKTVVKQPL
jgi:hypothetical protein